MYYQVIVLTSSASTVHLESNHYCLGTNDSYVYAATIVKILEELYRPTIQVQPQPI